MGYKRRQKDLERQERKRRRDFKRNNMVTEMRSGKYKSQVIPNKKKYNTSDSSIDYLLSDKE
jgi:hypothetical protein